MERSLAASFDIARFPHLLNVTSPESDLRVQIQTDPRYADFVDRSETRPVLGIQMRVAALVDVRQGKIWAATNEARAAR
ncbi:MAG: hypothetical protein WD690_00750 [Vicinamibacterales bacterium]